MSATSPRSACSVGLDIGAASAAEIALAVVKRNTPEGATLVADETAATQETVVAP